MKRSEIYQSEPFGHGQNDPRSGVQILDRTPTGFRQETGPMQNRFAVKTVFGIRIGSYSFPLPISLFKLHFVCVNPDFTMPRISSTAAKRSSSSRNRSRLSGSGSGSYRTASPPPPMTTTTAIPAEIISVGGPDDGERDIVWQVRWPDGDITWQPTADVYTTAAFKRFERTLRQKAARARSQGLDDARNYSIWYADKLDDELQSIRAAAEDDRAAASSEEEDEEEKSDDGGGEKSVESAETSEQNGKSLQNSEKGAESDEEAPAQSEKSRQEKRTACEGCIELGVEMKRMRSCFQALVGKVKEIETRVSVLEREKQGGSHEGTTA